MMLGDFPISIAGPAGTGTHTLSLHDALPICHIDLSEPNRDVLAFLLPWLESYDGTVFHMPEYVPKVGGMPPARTRSEEHTSELQSHHDLVCRLLLEKKKKRTKKIPISHPAHI